MKSSTIRIGCIALLAGAAVLQGAAEARDGRAIAAGAGYRAGYNRNNYGLGYGYWGIDGAVPSSGGPTDSGTSAPTNYITKLPADAAAVIIFGQKYYFADGNYYSPVFYNGGTVYVIANP
jgi:hypothetical protein